MVMTAIAACNKDSEFHQTYIERPSDALLLVSGEAGTDSLVFYTTESFTMTTTVTTNGMTNDWYEYPDEFNTFNNTLNGAIIKFSIPITFKRNTTGQRRTVVFSINAGKYSASVAYVQDTTVSTPIKAEL